MAKLLLGSTIGNYEIWHKGNQGANSGLDADRLKGVNWTVNANAPTSPQVDDVWVDTKNFYIRVWNGTAWKIYSGDFTGLETTTSVDAKLNTKVDKVAGKDLSSNDYTTTEKNKLAGIATSANNYVHPATHPASIIVQDTNNRFVTDAEKTAWNARETTSGAQTKANTAETNAKNASVSKSGDTMTGALINNTSVATPVLEVKSATTEKKYKLQFNDVEGSLDFVFE